MSTSDPPFYIYLFTGYSGAGKDSMIDLLTQQVPSGTWHKFSFAQPIKEIAQDLIGKFYGLYIPLEWFYNVQKKNQVFPDWPRFNNKPFTLREVMQQLGTNIGRRYLGPDVWVNIVCQKIRQAQKDNVKLCLINDLRFVNELEGIKKAFPQAVIKVIRVLRDIPQDQERYQHVSESSSASIPEDIVIDNHYQTLQDPQLLAQINQLAQTLDL